MSDIKEILVPMFASLDEMMTERFPDPIEKSQQYKLLWYQQGLNLKLEIFLNDFSYLWVVLGT